MGIKIAIVVGTRPEIIKMAPVIRACEKRNVNFFILHSGQHYDANMDSVFFKELDLPKPKYNLNTGSKEYRKQVGNMMKGMKKIFLEEQPDAVLVQGDTITVLMGALAAKKWDIPVGHLEAGLRSHDMTMPEETNRIITDHVSEFLFAPTEDAIKNILDEGLNSTFASKTGNTIVDAVKQNLKIAENKSNILEKLKVKPKKYILATAHRQENTDHYKRLKGIMEGLEKVKRVYPDHEIIFSLHPRTKKKMIDHKIKKPVGVRFFEPVGFLEFIQLEKNAALCITDSGGVQEESSILRVPCVTIRDNTERPETIKAGMNVLAGTNPDDILKFSKIMMKRKIYWKDVFGDGKSGDRIVRQTIQQIKIRKSLKERSKWALRMLKKNTKSVFK